MRHHLFFIACLSAVLLTGGPVRAGGGEPPSQPDAIGCVQVHRDAAVVTFELRNGVVIHYRRSTGSPNISVCATLLGIESMEGEKTRALSMAAVAVVAPRLSLHTRMTANSPDGLKVVFVGPRSQLEPNVRLMADVFANPVVNAEGIPTWKAQYIKMLGEPLNEPSTVAARALQYLLADPTQVKDPRRRAVTPEDIQAITPEAALAWQRRLWAELPIEVGVSADLPVEQVIPAIVDALATIPARPDDAWAKVLAARESEAPRGRRLAEVRAALPPGDAIVLVAMQAPDMSDLADYRAMVVAKSILAERLPDDLRSTGLIVADRGLSLALSPGRGLRSSGLLVISARVHGEADSARIAAKVIKDTVRDLATVGGAGSITPEELKSHIEQVVMDARRQLSDSTYWAGVLSMLRYQVWSPGELVHATEGYRAVTAADIARVLSTYCAEDREATVLLASDQVPAQDLKPQP